MPIAKEFTIRLEDRPGTLGKLCQALAEQDVNILAYQQFPHEKGKGRYPEWSRRGVGSEGIPTRSCTVEVSAPPGGRHQSPS
jgi:ACT domain-containing protein